MRPIQLTQYFGRGVPAVDWSDDLYRGDKAEPAAGKNVGGVGGSGDNWFDITPKQYDADHESGDPHGGIGGWIGPLPVKIDASPDGDSLYALLSDSRNDYVVTGPTIETVQDRVRAMFGRHKYRWRISRRALAVSDKNEDEDEERN